MFMRYCNCHFCREKYITRLRLHVLPAKIATALHVPAWTHKNILLLKSLFDIRLTHYAYHLKHYLTHGSTYETFNLFFQIRKCLKLIISFVYVNFLPITLVINHIHSLSRTVTVSDAIDLFFAITRKCSDVLIGKDESDIKFRMDDRLHCI